MSKGINANLSQVATSNTVVKTKDILLSSKETDMQQQVIYSYLTRSYWAKGITQQLVSQSIKNSLCFGAYIDSKQVAFARVITDKTSFAYLADVFVLEPFRGKGISKLIMREVMAHADLQTIRRFMLCTADAHGLYQQFGFSEAKSPENLMAIHRVDIYKSS